MEKKIQGAKLQLTIFRPVSVPVQHILKICSDHFFLDIQHISQFYQVVKSE